MNLLKKLKKFWLVFSLMLFIFFSGFSSVLAATQEYLNITSNVQEETEWCWAATSKTVISWLKSVSPVPTQSDIVRKVKGRVINEAANNAEDLASLTKFNVSNASKKSYIEFSSIKTYITGWKSPIKTGISTGISGHSHVIYGYYENGSIKSIRYMDPSSKAPARFNSMSYEQYKNNNKWRWIWTIYGNKKAS